MWNLDSRCGNYCPSERMSNHHVWLIEVKTARSKSNLNYKKWRLSITVKEPYFFYKFCIKLCTGIRTNISPFTAKVHPFWYHLYQINLQPTNDFKILFIYNCSYINKTGSPTLLKTSLFQSLFFLACVSFRLFLVDESPINYLTLG